MRLLASAALLVFASGCSTLVDDGDYTQDQYEQERDAAVAALMAAIGEAWADDVDDCRVVEVGVRPCGQVAMYRIYSSTDGDQDEIEALAARVTETDHFAIGQLGLVGTCEAGPGPPEPVLVGGRCTTDPIIIN